MCIRDRIYRTLPYYRAGSRVINVASVAAFLPQPKLAVYSAAKRFILDLSRSLNAELGEDVYKRQHFVHWRLGSNGHFVHWCRSSNGHSVHWCSRREGCG